MASLECEVKENRIDLIAIESEFAQRISSSKPKHTQFIPKAFGWVILFLR